jgi:DNA-binding MarR family transcriptional regulator
VWQDDATMSDSKRPEGGETAEPRISYAIARLHQLILASVSKRAGQHGLTALQFTTLSVLNRHGAPLSSSQLARRSFMTAQSMHEVIHRLEQEGLIERNPHPDHGRKLPASLTVKGRRVLAACEAAVVDFETKMLSSFSKADRATFLNAVKSAAHNLGGGFGEAGGLAANPDRSASMRARRRA